MSPSLASWQYLAARQWHKLAPHNGHDGCIKSANLKHSTAWNAEKSEVQGLTSKPKGFLNNDNCKSNRLKSACRIHVNHFKVVLSGR